MSITLNKTKRTLLVLILIYLIYLVKCALGINISNRYTVPGFVKYPLIVTDCVVDLKINFCQRAFR